MKKALIFGASGFVGSFLLEELLGSSDYDLVIAVTRKKLPQNSPKLKNLIGDFANLKALKNELVADDVFIALGTTKKNTPDESEYYKVDHDYPVLAARLAKENGAKSLFVVTAVGANKDSKVFYLRTKGEVEQDLQKLNFEHTVFFRPSMILGSRGEPRPLEKALIKFWPFVESVLVGGLNIYRGTEGKTVAKSMIHAAKKPIEKCQVFHWKEMRKFV